MEATRRGGEGRAGRGTPGSGLTQGWGGGLTKLGAGQGALSGSFHRNPAQHPHHHSRWVGGWFQSRLFWSAQNPAPPDLVLFLETNQPLPQS